MSDITAIRINHAALDQVGADLVATVQEIDRRLDQLATDLAPLRSDWDGRAQTAYQSAKSQWELAIHEMKELLGRTAATVHESNAAYRDADRRGEAMFR